MPLVHTTDTYRTAVFGWGVLGYKVFGTTWLPSIRDSKEAPQIHVFDSDFVYVGRVQDAEYFSWQYNWYYADVFELKINRYKTSVDQFEAGGFIAFQDESLAWHVGIIQKISKPLGSTGKDSEIWSFVGQSYESIFQERICMHATDSGDGFNTKNSYTTKNMWSYVSNEAYNPTDAKRRYAHLHMDTSSNLGEVYTYKARFETLAAVLEKHVRYDPSYSYYLDWQGYTDGSANRENFMFKIRTGRNKLNEVKLSSYFGNIVGYDYLYDAANEKTLVYIGGTGSANLRDISENWKPNLLAANEPSGRNRKEIFKDALDCTDDASQRSRAIEILNDASANQSCTFEFSPYTSDYVFLYDFKVGDEITVQIDDVVTMYARLISATETYDARGRKVKLTIGKEKPDLIKIIRSVNDQVKKRTLV